MADEPRRCGKVLVLNCGSSTVKAAVVDPVTGRRLAAATVETAEGEAGSAVRSLLAAWRAELHDVVAVGHRMVHGGERFTAPTVVDDGTVAGLRDLVRLAPLQMPASLDALGAARRAMPRLPHVAVFDTAFHHTLPPVAHRYAVPHEWYADLGVRRYGFHGISHRYVAHRAAVLLDRPLADLRLVTLHLGNGCSGAAVRGGRSVDTTMGMTPLEGLVMGTRSGDVDPGVVAYVSRATGTDAEAVVETLNERSGLLGLSGSSHDCRIVEAAAAEGSQRARLALDVFAYRAAKSVGALAVALGALDALVLTGGVGEHSVGVRRSIMSHLAVLGIREDAAANARHGVGTGGRVSRPGPTVALVVPTDEELVIARDTAALAAPGLT